MKTLITRHKAGEPGPLCFSYSAHPLVIEAALSVAYRNATRKVLIEATSDPGGINLAVIPE
ncbi:class II D-tagatose-bisphosphate aldolase non-catalytic subunit [Escherichia coli]